MNREFGFQSAVIFFVCLGCLYAGQRTEISSPRHYGINGLSDYWIEESPALLGVGGFGDPINGNEIDLFSTENPVKPLYKIHPLIHSAFESVVFVPDFISSATAIAMTYSYFDSTSTSNCEIHEAQLMLVKAGQASGVWKSKVVTTCGANTIPSARTTTVGQTEFIKDRNGHPTIIVNETVRLNQAPSFVQRLFVQDKKTTKTTYVFDFGKFKRVER